MTKHKKKSPVILPPEPTKRFCSKCGKKHLAPTGSKCPAVVKPVRTSPKQTTPVKSPAKWPLKSHVRSPKILKQLKTIDARQEHAAETLTKLNQKVKTLEDNAIPPKGPISPEPLDHGGISPKARFQKRSGKITPIVSDHDDDDDDDLDVGFQGGIGPIGSYRYTSRDDALLGAAGLFPRSKARKSGIYQSSIDYVLNEVKWPQLHVRRLGRDPPEYDELTIPEFVVGYLKIIEKLPGSLKDICRSIGYLKSLMEDTAMFNWVVARESHAQVLTDIEQGLLRWTANVSMNSFRKEAIMRMMLTPDSQVDPLLHTQRAGVDSGQITVGQATADDKQPDDKIRVCFNFNKGTCSHQADHNTNGLMWIHICQHCISRTTQFNQHPEISCNRKRKGTGSKNAKWGERNVARPALLPKPRQALKNKFCLTRLSYQ